MYSICHTGDFTPKRRREGTRIPIDLQAKRRSAWHCLRCDINTKIYTNMLFDVMIYTYHNHTGERTASSMSSVSHLGYRSRYIRYMVMNSNECKEAKGRSKGSSEITWNGNLARSEKLVH